MPRPLRRKPSSRATATTSDLTAGRDGLTDHRRQWRAALVRKGIGWSVERRASVSRTERWWLFLTPSAVVLGLVMLYPLSYAVYLSLFDDDLGTGSHGNSRLSSSSCSIP